MTDSGLETATLLDVLGDPLCREVIVIASESPVSANILADQLDVSPPTVYRRVNRLIDHKLVREHRRVDAEGNHFRSFETVVDRVEVVVTQEGYEIRIHRRQDVSDQFDDFWTELTSTEFADREDQLTGTDSGTDPSPS